MADASNQRIFAAILRLEADKQTLSESDKAVRGFIDNLSELTDTLKDTDKQGKDSTAGAQKFRDALLHVSKALQDTSKDGAKNLRTALGELGTTMAKNQKDIAALGIDTGKLKTSLRDLTKEGLVEFQQQAQKAFATRGAERMKAAIDAMQRSADKVAQAFGEVEQIGQGLTQAGQGIIATYQQLAQVYLDKVGKGEAIGRRWLDTNQKMIDQQIRLGRVATQALQPLFDQMVKLLTLAADFAEKNPAIVNGLVNIGAILLAAGTAATAAATVAKVATSVIQIAATLRNGGPEAAGLKGGLIVGAGIAGFGLGVAGTQAIGKATGNKDLENIDAMEALKRMKDFVLQTIVLAGNAIARLILQLKDGFEKMVFDLRDMLADLVKSLGKGIGDFVEKLPLGGELGKAIRAGGESGAANLRVTQAERDAQAQGTKDATERANANLIELTKMLGLLQENKPGGAGAGSQIPTAILDEYQQYLTETDRMNTTFHNKQLNDLQQFNQSQSQAMDDFRKQQSQATLDFARSQTQAVADFAFTRKQEDTNFNRETLKAQQDFNYEREKADKQHYFNIQEAAARGDALAVINEMRSMAHEDTQAKADFAKEQKRRKQEFDQQQKDAAVAFARQQKQAKDNFTYQQKIAYDAFVAQQKLQHDNFVAQQRQEQSAFNVEMQNRELDFQNKIRQELGYQTQSQIMNANYYANLTRLLQNFINQNLSAFGSAFGSVIGGGHTGGSGLSGSYAAGGYTPSRPSAIMAGESGREFVNTASTTAAMERYYGRQINQRDVVNLTQNRGGASVNPTLNFYGVGGHSVGELEAMTQRALLGVLKKANAGEI